MAMVRQRKPRVELVSPKGVRVTVGRDAADRYKRRGYLTMKEYEVRKAEEVGGAEKAAAAEG